MKRFFVKNKTKQNKKKIDFDQISPACGKHSKELQMVFLTSTVINSNGNMKELERKFKCEKGISYCCCKCWHRKSEMSFVIP